MHKTRALGSTVYFWFAANDTSGSGADGETPQCDVRLAGDEADAAPVLSPTPTLLTHADYGAGLHEVAIAATAENGFAAGNEYAVFCTLLVDSQNPAGFLGSFYLTDADQAPLTVDDIQNGLPRDDQWTDARAALIDQLDAATDDTVANILADITEEADGTYRITAAALALLHDLSAQEVRDALKLAPTVGDPAEGSVDAMLDAIGDSAFDPASDEVNIGSVKGVAVSGVSDFRATGFAVAGDAMTLTPSERGSVAAAVWAVLTSALTTEGSIGKLIVDLGARIGAFTGTGVNTILGFFRALMRSDATLPADVGGTFDPTTDALEALRNRGDSGAWSGAAGSGSNKVEVTASDGAGLLANGVKVTVEDADGNTVGILTTNSLGVVIFYLDDGTYTFVTATTSFWQGSSTEVEVSGDTAVALTLGSFTPPDPPTGDYCTVYGFAESVGGTIAEGTVRIRALHAPDVRGEDDEPVAVFFSDQDTATFDANGYWHLAVLRNAVVDIHFEYSNGDDQWARKLVIPDQPSGNWKTFEMA